MDLVFQLATVCRPISKIKCSQKVNFFHLTSGKIGHSGVTTNSATATNCVSLYDLRGIH